MEANDSMVVLGCCSGFKGVKVYFGEGLEYFEGFFRNKTSLIPEGFA